MQGSKSNFFNKSEKRSRFDDENWNNKASGNVKQREKTDKNKESRRIANRQQSQDD